MRDSSNIQLAYLRKGIYSIHIFRPAEHTICSLPIQSTNKHFPTSDEILVAGHNMYNLTIIWNDKKSAKKGTRTWSKGKIVVSLKVEVQAGFLVTASSSALVNMGGVA